MCLYILMFMTSLQEADLILTDLSITSGRAAAIDFTTGYYYTSVVLMAMRPDSTHMGGTFFSMPFHWMVYVLLGCGLAVMAAMLMLLAHCSREWRRDNTTPRKPSVVDVLLDTWEMLFGESKFILETVTSVAICNLHRVNLEQRNDLVISSVHIFQRTFTP
jgi:ABC-type amino acid transport substrate-binding protein